MKLNIRTRLTLQFTYIVTFILVLFSLLIYYFSANYRMIEFYSRLENKATNTAKLLIEVKEVDYELLKIIDRNTINALFDEKIVIYNYKDQQIYNSLDEDTIHVSKVLLDEIRLKKKIRYHEGNHEVVGLLYTDKYDRFVVVASAFDKYGLRKLNNLKWILSIGLIFSVGLTLFTGNNFASKALKPMSNVIKQVDKITISSLNMRVDEGNSTDEIAQLAVTFNRMLERLESAFEMQRSFVSNASHELRTPFTSIIGQIEVALLNPRTNEEYKEILKSILEDIKNLNELSNGLLDLAKASSDISGILLRQLRIDEVLWETRTELSKRKKDYNISIHFNESLEDENDLIVLANHHLLKIALVNVMDNACKYSPDHAVNVLLSRKERHVEILFADNGMGIDPADLEKILQPFFRAKNARNIYGNGLGLSLTDKIIHLHRGTIQIESQLNQGTRVVISLPCAS
ncbi:MAG: ATP-binding protein [Candidatus Saccharibacteria bacterium]